MTPSHKLPSLVSMKASGSWVWNNVWHVRSVGAAFAAAPGKLWILFGELQECSAGYYSVAQDSQSGPMPKGAARDSLFK